jgi:hypothetical protein
VQVARATVVPASAKTLADLTKSLGLQRLRATDNFHYLLKNFPSQMPVQALYAWRVALPGRNFNPFRLNFPDWAEWLVCDWHFESELGLVEIGTAGESSRFVDFCQTWSNRVVSTPW